MVLSCLVEPLVPPLVGGAGGSARRSALRSSRLMATALTFSALVAVTTALSADEATQTESDRETSQAIRRERNPHRAPAPLPAPNERAETALALFDLPALPSPSEDLGFRWDAWRADREGRKRRILGGESLGHGTAFHVGRPLAAKATVLVGSGRHRSGTENPIVI